MTSQSEGKLTKEERKDFYEAFGNYGITYFPKTDRNIKRKAKKLVDTKIKDKSLEERYIYFLTHSPLYKN